MATGESTVYNRREGTGEAQIFGREGNPFNAVLRRRQEVQQKEAIAFERDKQARKERDQKMFEILAVSPEKTFEPFNQQVMDSANAHRAKVVEYFNGGGTVNPSFAAWNKSQWDQINDKARKGAFVQQKMTEVMDNIKKNPYLDESYYLPKIWDKIMDSNGKGKDINSLDLSNIDNLYNDDPGGFNLEKYNKDFLSNIKDNVFNWVIKRNTNLGTETSDAELKVKGSLYTPDDSTSSGVAEDANGHPIVNVTSDLLNSYMSSPLAKKKFEQEAAARKMTPKQLMEETIAQSGGGFNLNVRPSSKFYPSDNGYGSGVKKQELPAVRNILKATDNLVNAFTDENGNRLSKPRPGAVEAIGYFKKGARFGDGYAVDATLVPGSPEEGKAKVFGNDLDNSVNDRLVVKVQMAGGKHRLEQVDLADESAMATAYGMLQNTGALGKSAIPIDVAIEASGINPTFKGGENQKTRLFEQAINNQASEISKGNGYEAMSGKVYKGKPIVGVTTNNSFLGMGGLSGYTIKFADGTTEVISKDNKAALKEILLSPDADSGTPSATEGEVDLGLKFD